MADYVAFDEDLKQSYSIYDALELNQKDKQYYCLCGSSLFVRNESIHFTNKRGVIIQRAAHFSHYKKNCCEVRKAFKISCKDNNYYDDAPVITEEEKRKKIINNILKIYRKSMANYDIHKQLIKDANKIADNNKIDYSIIMNEYIEKILYSSTKGIGFKEIEFTDIDYTNEIYIIIDVMNETISNSCIEKICNDFEKYKIYIKKLSLISLFASRCIDFDAVSLNTYSYIEKLELMINIYKKEKELRPVQLVKYYKIK
jgi:hypothetical protein